MLEKGQVSRNWPLICSFTFFFFFCIVFAQKGSCILSRLEISKSFSAPSVKMAVPHPVPKGPLKMPSHTWHQLGDQAAIQALTKVGYEQTWPSYTTDSYRHNVTLL